MIKAIVIGGTSGIGKELVQILLKKNYRVGITGVEKNIIKELQELKDENVNAKHFDATEGNCVKKISQLVKLLGGLDLLIFSAGIGNLNKNLGYKVENHANKLNVIAFTEIADWSYKFFEKQGNGHFVGISSIAGLIGYRVAPAYHAAKSYQMNYLEGLRQKAEKSKKSIYITDIRPGFVDTEMYKDKKRFWVASKSKAAKQIFYIINKKKGVGYVSRRWLIVAVFLKLLPNWIRKKM